MFMWATCQFVVIAVVQRAAAEHARFSCQVKEYVPVAVVMQGEMPAGFVIVFIQIVGTLDREFFDRDCL
jgi:hypothetical protein